jgi:hypothetical protein
MTALDERWKEVAEASRGALELLGYRVPRCLPGEPEACGGNYSEHAVAHLTAIKAVADHQLDQHLRPPEWLPGEVYAHTTEELVRVCDLEHWPRSES